MSRQLAIGRVTELVLQSLGKGLHPCFRHVVREVPRRHSYPLLGACAHNDAWLAAFYHALQKGFGGMHNPKEVHPKRRLPAAERFADPARNLEPSVAVQEMDCRVSC